MPKAQKGVQVLRDGQGSFSGGLNLSASPWQLRPNEVRRAQNARLTPYGGITKRYGCQRIHASALSVASAGTTHGVHWADASLNVVLSSTLLYTSPPGAIPRTFTNRGSTMMGPGSNHWSAPFYDGSGLALYFVGSGNSNLSKITLPSYTISDAMLSLGVGIYGCTVYNQRLFAFSAGGQTLYWSGLNDGDTLGDTSNGGGSAIIRTFGQSEIQGLLPVGNSLAIFHRRGISMFTGWSQDDFNINSGTRGLSGDVGLDGAYESLVRVENVGYFLSSRGFYRITEAGIEQISVALESLFPTLSVQDFYKVRAVHAKHAREIWWYLPDIGVYCYNYRLNAWTGPWTNEWIETYDIASGAVAAHAVQSLWSSFDGLGNPIILSGKDDGFVRQMDKTGVYFTELDSTGTSVPPPAVTGYPSIVPMVFQCRRFDFKRPVGVKALRHLLVAADLNGSTTDTISWVTPTAGSYATVSLTSAGTVWDASTWDGGVWSTDNAGTGRVQAHGQGAFVDVSVSCVAAAAPVYNAIVAEAFDYGERY